MAEEKQLTDNAENLPPTQVDAENCEGYTQYTPDGYAQPNVAVGEYTEGEEYTEQPNDLGEYAEGGEYTEQPNDFGAYAEGEYAEGEEFAQEVYDAPCEDDGYDPNRRFSFPKDQRAISRQRRNKIIGRVLACVVILVFFGVLVGGTTLLYKGVEQIWWDAIGEEAGVEFKELFTLFNGVVDADEDKIVTKGFSEDDLAQFYSNLKRKTLISQDSDITVSQLVAALMSSAENNTQDSTQTYSTIGTDGYDLQYATYAQDGSVILSDEKPTQIDIQEVEGTPAQSGSDTLTGNEALDSLLAQLEFDFSSLAQYDGEKYILEISDRQLGAVVNEALSCLSQSFTQMQELETAIGKSLGEVLAVKQIIISGNEVDATQTSFKLTLEVKVRDLVPNILKQYGIPTLVKYILPEKLYASVTVYPYDASKPIEAAVNRLEEANVNKIVRIVDVILSKSGQTTSLNDMLVKVNGKVVDVLNQAQQTLPIALVPTGSVDLYPIETFMGMLDVEVSEQAFLYMLRDVKLPTGESLGLILPTPEETQAQTEIFVSQLGEKYCLDNTIANISTDNTIKDVMNFASGDNVLEAIRLNDRANTSMYSSGYGQHLKVRTSYEALAGMLSDYVRNEKLMGNLSADIVEMSYAPANGILSVEIRVNLAQMLGCDDDSVYSTLIRKFIPQYVYVSANICLDADKNIPTTIEINKVGEDDSRTHLATLTALAEKFGLNASSLTYDGICSQIDDGLKSGLAQMQEQIGCDIVFTVECAYLPDLFEVVCGTGLLDEDEDHKIEAETLFNIMKQVYTFDVESSDRNRTDDLDSFIAQLESKYYLLQGKVDEILGEDGYAGFLQGIMKLSNAYGSSLDKDALASDSRAMSELYPLMTAGEFAYMMLLNLNMDEMSEMIKTADVLGARILDNNFVVLYLQATLYVSDDTQLGDGEESADLSKYSNLLPESAFVILTIDTDKVMAGQSDSVQMTIDGMSESNMADFFSIVRKLTGNSATSEEIETQIGEQFHDYMQDIHGIDYEFVGGVLKIDNLFNVIAASDILQSDVEGDRVFTPDEIRKLMRQLYGYAYQGGDFVVASNLDYFIDVELYDKYFISEGFAYILKGYAENNTLLDGITNDLKSDDFLDRIRVKDLLNLDNVTQVEGKSESQIAVEVASNFQPVFSKEELAYLLRKQTLLAGDMSFLKDQEVVFADNDENIMTLTLRGKGNLEDENAMGLMPEYFYVTVTIELGDIVKGIRTDMNVYALDVNSMAYVQDKREESQELELLLEFIERIQRNTQQEGEEPIEETSLDSIMQSIEEELNGADGFKESIHNEVYTVTFLSDGGFILNETVCQIALNSIYGVKANELNTQADMPAEIDFRNGLCKIHNMPDTFEYTQDVFIDLAVGNRAENSANAIEEINDKYALTHPLVEGTAAILTILGEYAKDYASNIDGLLLTSDDHRAKSVEELSPTIIGEELIWLLEDSVSFQADGYQDAVMTALYIRGDVMIIVYKSPVETSEADENYAQLIPEEMAIIVEIELAAVDIDGVICTQIGINNLIDSEVYAIQSMIAKLNEGADGESKSIDDANVECSDSVRKTMRSLIDNVDVTYEAGETNDGVTDGGKMILASIYEISAQKINAGDDGADEVTPLQVKATLEALFDGLNVQAYTPPTGLSAEEMKIHYTMDPTLEKESNLYIQPNVAQRTMTISGAIGGWNIASMIDTDKLLEPLGLNKSTGGSGETLVLKHTALVPTRANGDGTFEAIRQELGSLGDRDYFLITLDLDMVAAAGMKMSILPERMDLTLYMDLTDETVSVIYNAMTDEQRSILSRLVKTSRPEGVSGLDLSNTDAVKAEIMDMVIIDEEYMGYTFTVTLGELLRSGGIVLPISKAMEQVEKDANVVLGMGAIIINYSESM